MTSRLLTTFALIYTALVFYGSLMPWDLDWDPAAVSKRLALVLDSLPFMSKVHVSKIDLVSNFVLYVPLGFLVASRVALGRRRTMGRALSRALLWGGALTLAVEVMQLLLPTRTTDLHDLLMNTAGALAGGFLGWSCGRRVWIGLRRRASLEASRRPVSIGAVLVIVLLTADAFFPYYPTLDVSAVMRSVRVTLGHGFTGGFALHSWSHWLVIQVGVYAVLAALLSAWVGARDENRWRRGALWAFVFAAALELGKTFIVSRHTNLANVIMAGVGCAIGLAGYTALRGRISSRRTLLLAGSLLALFIIYLELEPFDFTWDPAAMSGKVPSGAEWLPLYHYAISGRGEKVFLFVRTITLLAAMTVCLRLSAPSPSLRTGMIPATLLAGGFGLLLELGQFLIPGRVPSVTDVLCFATGGAIGALCANAWERRQRRLRPRTGESR